MKVKKNDVLGSGFQAPSGSDLVGTRPWRRACKRAHPALRRLWMDCDAAWKRRGGTGAWQRREFDRVSLCLAVAPHLMHTVRGICADRCVRRLAAD
jgi:hypothetical protein